MKRLLLAAALTLGAVACHSHPHVPTGCRVTHPSLVGADYSHGTWTSASGVVIGHAAQEDSVITIHCGDLGETTVAP